MWETAAKWVAIIAAIVLLIGGPTYWHGKKVEEAYDLGYQQGRNSVILENEAIKRKWMATEEEEAAKRLEEKEKVQRNVVILRKKLDEALAKEPVVAGCVLNPNPTAILRDAAAGIFHPDADDLSGGLVGKVPGAINIPGDYITIPPRPI